MVRNMRAVLKKASWGTRRIFGSVRCKKTGFYGTERAFGARKPPFSARKAFSEELGAQNRLFRYGRDIRCQKQAPVVRGASSKARRTADSTDCGQPPAHRTHLQCAKRPPLSLFAPAHSTISFVPLTRNLSPAAPSLAPSTALGTRNGPRSEVSRHKEEADPFWSTSSQKVILIYRRHGRHTVNFVSSFVEKREMLTLTSSLSGER